jgi:hypothetical protein
MPLATLVVVGGIILLGAGVGFLILNNLPAWLQTSETVVLLVAGLVAVMLLLYLGTIIMRTAGLTSEKEALGMPEGSIRALIAVSLILMFAIIGVTVLNAGVGGQETQSLNITAEELGRLENVQIIAISAVDPAASPGTERFNVTAIAELSEAGHDFGLQLLTTVSTLVVAVAGFYFGSRAVSQGAKTANEAQQAVAEARAARAAALAGAASPVTVEVAPTGEEEVVAPIDEGELVGAVEDVNDAEGDGAADVVIEVETAEGEGEAKAEEKPPGS